MLKTASSFANSIGALNYKGTWNASTNTPTLVSSVGTKGDYYVVSVAGTTNLDGTTLWGVGDLAAFNGTIWQKIDGGDTGLFTSITVAGLTGYMYANNNTPVTASTTIPVASVTGAVPNTVNVLASGLLTGGGALTGNVTVGLTSVPVANVPGAVQNTVNVLTSGLLSGGGALTGNVTVSLTSVPFANVTGAGTMASQNANAVAITGGTVDNVVIGGTTPNAATVTTLTANSTAQFGRASANYQQAVGAATGLVPVHSVLGSDANIALAFQSKGTGAIDLASGSSGVNISNGGTVTAITRTAGGTGYTVAPTITISAPTTAGGVQATATCTVTAGVVDTTFTITNAGSGYVEQPTITFTPVSGGSGAAAYATVGSIPTVKTLGSAISFNTDIGELFRVTNSAGTTTSPAYINVIGGGSTNVAQYASGAVSAISFGFVSKGTSPINFSTNGTASNQQFAVSHTASAVNYVQVTGAATTVAPVISAQGSDTNINIGITAKGTGVINLNAATRLSFGSTNYVQVAGAATTVAPVISSQGTDTNIDLTLTPKGTGVVQFGTYTASVLTPTGYITIKDSGGTTRRLLVG